MGVALYLTLFTGLCLILQGAGVALALAALWRKPAGGPASLPPITVLRPVCGLESFLEETLDTTFRADYPTFELIFCAADPADPAVALVQKLMARHPGVAARLLTGDDKISGNPKLNNLVKGWNAAKYDHVLMSDSNVILPPDYLRRCMAEFTPATGLVSSPPIGIRPYGFWGRVECAFLNTFQARWQMAASTVGNGYAQGKMLLWDARVLNAAGGIAVLGKEMAEDVASTKTVRAAGKVVRLPGRFFQQPIGARKRSVVWARQVRWAKVRRLGFPLLFLPEVLAGAALPFLSLLMLVALGASVWTIPTFLMAWYGAEYLLAIAADWPRAPADLAAWVTRDALLPALWIAAWQGNSFEWRGNTMTAAGVSQPKTPLQTAPQRAPQTAPRTPRQTAPQIGPQDGQTIAAQAAPQAVPGDKA